MLPDEAHDGALQFSKFGGIVGWRGVTSHNATKRNIARGSMQEVFRNAPTLFRYATGPPLVLGQWAA